MYIAQYIKHEDYACPCCGQVPPDLHTSEVYQFLFTKYALVVDDFGHEPKISSGYRCTKHNKTVGGSHASVHLFGLALDADLNSVDETERFENAVESVYPSFRMGVYKVSGSFVHVDVGFKIIPRATPKWREGARWYQ